MSVLLSGTVLSVGVLPVAVPQVVLPESLYPLTPRAPFQTAVQDGGCRVVADSLEPADALSRSLDQVTYWKDKDRMILRRKHGLLLTFRNSNHKKIVAVCSETAPGRHGPDGDPA